MKDAIGFIGLGNMGFPMAGQLLQAGHPVRAFDTDKGALERAGATGVVVAGSIAEAVAGASAIITMLPAGAHVREVYLCERGVIASAERGALLIDSSTIDMETSRAVGNAAAGVGHGVELDYLPGLGGFQALGQTLGVRALTPQCARGLAAQAGAVLTTPRLIR